MIHSEDVAEAVRALLRPLVQTCVIPEIMLVQRGLARVAVSDSPLVDVTLRDHVALLRLTNAERRNRPRYPHRRRRCRRRSSRLGPRFLTSRCVVIAGSAGIFASGADIRELESASAEENLAYKPPPCRASVKRGRGAADGRRSRRSTGHAIGGGLELALACLMRVRSRRKRSWACRRRSWGSSRRPAGSPGLPILVPRTAAAELALTGDLITGAEAKALGLVNYVVEPDQVLDRALELAAKIAKVAPLAAQANLRKPAPRRQPADRRRQPAVEDRLAALLASSDRREGARAFLERREPRFEGH